MYKLVKAKNIRKNAEKYFAELAEAKDFFIRNIKKAFEEEHQK